MKKLIFVLFIIILLLSSCSDNDIILENETLKDIKVEGTHHSADTVYVLNLKTHKYHLKSCRYASIINQEIKFETTDMEFITTRGYSPCGICLGDN